MADSLASQKLDIPDLQTSRHRIVIGVGCQKAGTTSISEFLFANGLISPRKKELHAFPLSRELRPVSRAEYLRLLRVRTGNKVFGEFTPNYLAHPTAIWNLQQAVPEAKIIVSLRNPINRAFSGYTHAVGAGRISRTLTFSEAVELALMGSMEHWILGIITEGLYAKGIKRLLNLYPRESVLIANYDSWTLPENTKEFEEELLLFSGLTSRTGGGIPRINDGEFHRAKQAALSETIEPDTSRILRRYFQRSKDELEEILNESLGWW
jgi:hypothetical protein